MEIKNIHGKVDEGGEAYVAGAMSCAGWKWLGLWALESRYGSHFREVTSAVDVAVPRRNNEAGGISFFFLS